MHMGYNLIIAVIDTGQMQMWDMVVTVKMAKIAELDENSNPTG